MNYLDQLKLMATPEISLFIKENSQNEQFLSELVGNKESFISLFLSQKIYPVALLSSLIEDNQDLVCFLSACMEHSFVPSIEMIESLSAEPGFESLILNVLTKFPSLPVSTQLVMRFINRNLEEEVVKILQLYPLLRKPEIYDVMLVKNFQSLDFISLYFSEERNKDLYLEVLDDTFTSSMDEFIYPASFSNFYILKFGVPKDEILKFLILRNYLNSQAFEVCINSFVEILTKDRDFLSEKINWHDSIENLPETLVSKLKFSFVPETSKYRKKFISNSPECATDQEIIDLIDQKRSFIYPEALKRSFSIAERLDLSILQEKISPSELVRQILSSVDSKEKMQFFYKSLPSKYADYIYKNMSIEDAPERKKGKKRSYFVELFEAIKQRNLSSFRENLNYGYSLTQFHEDSNTSSKQRNCELLSSLEWEFYSQFTKAELLCLCETPIEFCSPDENAMLSFKVDENESYTLLEKFTAQFVFNNTEDQEQFILNTSMDKDQLSNLFNNQYGKIVQQPKLLQAFLIVLNDNQIRVEMKGKSAAALAEHLTASELKIILTMDEHSFEDYLNIVCSDGEFLVSFDQIEKHISKQRTNMEDERVLMALSRRNPEYYKGLINAYLGGNKDLSDFFGVPVSIKRMKKDLFQRLKGESLLNVEEEVERIFSSGAQLESFSQSFFDWEIVLQKYGNNRQISVTAALVSELKSYHKVIGVNFKIENLVIGHEQESFDEDELLFVLSKDLSNISIEKLIIESGACSESFLKNTLPSLSIKLGVDATFSETMPAESKIEVILAGYTQFDENQVYSEIIDQDCIEKLSLKQLQYLDTKGLVLTRSLVEKIVESNIENKELLTWLKERVGDFDGLVFGEDLLTESEKNKEWLLNLGIGIMDEESLWMHKTKEKLLREGSDFSPVVVDNLNLDEIMSLIKFIGDNVDPNYNKLDLESTNIVELEILAPYKIMTNALSFKDEELIKNFLIPQNLQTKKILKSLRELVSLKGLSLTYKVLSIQEFLKELGAGTDLTLSDFVNLENLTSLDESHNLQEIDNSVLQYSFSNVNSIKGKLLVGQGKSNILRFLRTATEHGISYVKDIFSMFDTVVNGISSLESRLQILSAFPEANEEEMAKIQDSIFSLKKRLDEISTMERAVDIHDRLAPMASLIATNPTQPLGQDKFNGIEFSEEVTEDLGYALYFPKVRSDLQYLGDHNGWCVNSSKSYGDDVIKKNNILVGICEKNTPPSKENVIALAHLIHRGNKKYTLEQLRWSSRKKSGAKNQDATSSFNYRKIIAIIENYLQQ